MPVTESPHGLLRDSHPPSVDATVTLVLVLSSRGPCHPQDRPQGQDSRAMPATSRPPSDMAATWRADLSARQRSRPPDYEGEPTSRAASPLAQHRSIA